MVPSFNLESASTTAIGPFNPHIITPDWLVKNKVCDAGAARLRMVTLAPNLAQAFEFPKGVRWDIDYRQLLINSRNENCGELAAKVIDLLKHTPVRAVGHNFHYYFSQRPGPMFLPTFDPAHKQKINGLIGKVEQLRWTCVLNIKDAVVEMTLADEPELSLALFNFHRETSGVAHQASIAARCFDQDRQESEALLNRLFST